MSCIFNYKGIIYLEDGIKRVIAKENNLSEKTEIKTLPFTTEEVFRANAPKLFTAYSSNQNLQNIGSIYQYNEYLIATEGITPNWNARGTEEDVKNFENYVKTNPTKSSAFSSIVNANMNGTTFSPDELDNIYSVMNSMFIMIEDKFKNKGLDDKGHNFIRSTLANSWEADYNKNINNFSDVQKKLIEKAIKEIRTNDWFWYTFKNQLSSNLGYMITDEIELDPDLTKKDFREDDRLNINPLTTVSDTIKRMINTTFEIDPNSVNVVDGKRVYTKNKNTPTGYPNLLNYKRWGSKIMELMEPARNIDEAMDIIYDFSNSSNSVFAKTLLSVYDKLLADQDLRNAWWSSYNKAIIDSTRTLTRNTGERTAVDIDVANKNKSEYMLANAWQDNIIVQAENGIFTKDFIDNWYKRFNELASISTSFNIINDEVATGLTELYSELGISLDKNTILRESKVRPTEFVTNIIMPILYITGSPSNSFKIKDDGYIPSMIKKPTTKFNQYGSILKLASRAKFLNENRITYSSTTVKGNLMYDPQNPNFLSDFFQDLNNADETTYNNLLNYTKVYANQTSSLIWGNEYRYDEQLGTYALVRKSVRKGIINYIVKNGSKIPIPYNKGGLNKDNLSKIKLFMYQGTKNLNTQTSKEYIDLNDRDWTKTVLLQYLTGTKEEGYAVYPLVIPSDRGRIALFQAPYYMYDRTFMYALVNSTVGNPKDAEFKDYVTTHSMYKAIRNTLHTELMAMETAFNHLFIKDDDGNIVFDEDENYIRPRVRPEILNSSAISQVFYHYKVDNKGNRTYLQFKKTKDGIKFDANKSGNVFSTHNIEYLFGNTPTTFETFGKLSEPLIMTYLKHPTMREFTKTSIIVPTDDINNPTRVAPMEEYIYKFLRNFIISLNSRANSFAIENADVLNTYLKSDKSGLNKANIPITTRLSPVRTEEGVFVTNTQLSAVETAFEFLANQYIFNTEQIRLFYGSVADYNGVVDFNKRAGSPEANGIACSLQGSFTGVTISDVVLRSAIYEDRLVETAAKLGIELSKDSITKLMVEYPNDTAAKESLTDKEYKVYIRVKPYLTTDIADATSYITLDEFNRRVHGFGKYDQYRDLMDKLNDPNTTLNRSELNRLATLQKNFYYNYDYNDEIGKFVPNQVKNAEVILSYRFTRNTQLSRLRQIMSELNIDQVNLATAEKTGSFNIVDITDSNGNLLDTETVKERLNAGKRSYQYKHLVMQQEVPDAVVDHQGKFAVQFAKKIISNIPSDHEYLINGEKVNGRALVEHYFNLLGANIFKSAEDLFDRYGITIDEEGNFVGDLSINTISKLLIDQSLTLDLGASVIAGLQLNKETGNPNIPLSFSVYQDRFQSILTSGVTKNVTTQHFPGIHAAQMSDMFLDKDFNVKVVGGKKEQNKASEILIEEYGNDINWIDSIKEDVKTGKRTYKLSPATKHVDENGNTIYRAEVLLPRYTKLFYDNDGAIDINKLPEEVRTMIGYRIPTEAKYSMYIFDVVGFLPDDMGATIVLPDDFVTQTGSDFDIDSVYTMYRNMIKDENGNIKLVEYTADETHLKDRYMRYVNDNIERNALKELQLDSRDLAMDETEGLYKEFKDAFNSEIGSIVTDEWKLESKKIKTWKKATFESRLDEFKYLGNVGKDLFRQLDSPIRKNFIAYERTISGLEGSAKNELYKQHALQFIDTLSTDDVNVSILQQMVEIYDRTNELIGANKETIKLVDEAYAKLKESAKNMFNAYKEGNKDVFLADLKEVSKKQQAIMKDARFDILLEAAKKMDLLDIDEFSKLPSEKQNTKKARQNRMFDIFASILTDKQHYLETNATSSFDNIQASKELLPPDKNILSMTTFDGQTLLRKRVMEGKTLKGRAVAANGFIAVAQTSEMHVSKANAIIFKYEIHEDQRDEFLERYKDDVIFETENTKLYAIVQHRFIANNPAGTFTNVLGHNCDIYFAEIPANTLDNVKKPLPPNVNPYLFGVWSLIPMLGSTYDIATLFINQPAILDLNKYHSDNENDYSGRKGLGNVKREYQTELFKLMIELDKIEIERAKLTGAEYTPLEVIAKQEKFIDKWISRIKTGQVISARPSQKAEYELLGYTDNQVTSIGVTDLKDAARRFTRNSKIVAKKGDKFVTLLQQIVDQYNSKFDIKLKPEGLSDETYVDLYNKNKEKVYEQLLTMKSDYIYQLKIIENFKHYSKLSDNIVDGQSIFKTDSLGAGPTFDTTHALMNKIRASNDESMLLVNARKKNDKGEYQMQETPAVVGIYPKLFKTSVESAYTPLQDYLMYSNIASVNAFRGLFISESALFRSIIDKIVTLQGMYSADKANKVVKFLNTALVSKLPWLSDLDQTEKNRLLGVNTKLNFIDISEITPETISEFEQLSVANQVEIIKNKLGDTNAFISNLKTNLKNADYERNGYYKIDFRDSDDLESITRAVNDLWYSDNIYERITARNLIRYEFLTSGFNYGYNSFSKVIPSNIFYEDTNNAFGIDGLQYNEMGIGLSRFLYGKQSEATKIEIDEDESTFADISASSNAFFGMDVIDTYIRNNWANDNIIPQATMRRDYDPTSPRLFTPDFNTNIIKLTGEEFTNIHDDFVGSKIKASDYIKLFSTNDETGEQVWTIYKRYDKYLTFDEKAKTYGGMIYYYPTIKLNGYEFGETSATPANNNLASGHEIAEPWEYEDLIDSSIVADQVKSTISDAEFNTSANVNSNYLNEKLSDYTNISDAIADGKVNHITVDITKAKGAKFNTVTPGDIIKLQDRDQYVEVVSGSHPDLSDLDKRVAWSERNGYSTMALNDSLKYTTITNKVPTVNYREAITFTASKGKYGKRTDENVQSTDFTLVIASDFDTPGERRTKQAISNSNKPYARFRLGTNDRQRLRAMLETLRDGSHPYFNAVDTQTGLSLIDSFKSVKGGKLSLNIAGNGIYTLTKFGFSQNEIDEITSALISGLIANEITITKITSGGQTGADEAGAKAGVDLGIDTEIHAPSDWAFRGLDNKDQYSKDKFLARFGEETATQGALDFDTKQEVNLSHVDKLIEYKVKYLGSYADVIASKTLTNIEPMDNLNSKDATMTSSIEVTENDVNDRIINCK